MSEKLSETHAKAASQHFVVYTPRPDVYVAVALKAVTSNASVHATIANYENSDKSKREYVGTVQAGSFNLVRLEAKDKGEAVEKAKGTSLRYEPIRVVLARYQEQLRSGTEQPQRESSSLKDAISEYLDPLQKFRTEVFGDKASPLEELLFGKRPQP